MAEATEATRTPRPKPDGPSRRAPLDSASRRAGNSLGRQVNAVGEALADLRAKLGERERRGTSRG